MFYNCQVFFRLKEKVKFIEIIESGKIIKFEKYFNSIKNIIEIWQF